MMLELIFHWTKLRSILIGFHLPTSVICPMGFTNGLTDNTIRITMTIHTQIQNQPFVSCKFNSFQIGSRQSFAASATAGRVAATIHELQPIGGRRVFFSKAMSAYCVSGLSCPTHSVVPTSDLYCCVSCSSSPSAPTRKLLPTVFDPSATVIFHFACSSCFLPLKPNPSAIASVCFGSCLDLQRSNPSS